MSHDKCTSLKVKKVMREFEKGKLKQKDGKKINNPKQAVAIGLSKAEKECKISKSEYKQMEKEVILYLKTNVTDKIVLSRIIEARELIEYYLKKNKIKKCKMFEILLYHFITNCVNSKITISSNIWSEINKIKNLDFERY